MKNSMMGLYTFGCLVLLLIQPSECVVNSVTGLSTSNVQTYGFRVTWIRPTTGDTPTGYEVIVLDSGVLVNTIRISQGNILQTVIRDLDCGVSYEVCVETVAVDERSSLPYPCVTQLTEDCKGLGISDAVRGETFFVVRNDESHTLSGITYQEVDEATGLPTGALTSSRLPPLFCRP
ncbi:uncharacterized protein [Amphiura filiformis]|uniref:uncharacterized protein n=1 Tax=Amphiura filiformis TaxID=82378 RepID=UPI003B210F85